MKKILVIILVIAVSMAPAVVFSYEAPTVLDLYIEADTLLSSYTDDYVDLLENREEDIEKLENRRISYRNTFYTAQSLASRDNGILQVDFNIENKQDSILAREAWLVIEFRAAYSNLYSSQNSVIEAAKSMESAADEYVLGKQNNVSGFVSGSELLQLEYKSVSAKNTATMKQRQYESSLRALNFKINAPIDYDEYEYDFSEEILPLNDLDFYLEWAMENVSSIKSIKQKLEKYYVEYDHYDVYSFSTNLSYIVQSLEELDINIRIQQLMLEKTKSELEEKIRDEYADLLIESERIALAELYVELLETEHDTNKSLYYRGYIGKDELDNSADALQTAKDDFEMKIYTYNTNIKLLEYDCAYYPKEGESK